MASPASSPDPVEDTLCPICKDPMRTPVSVNCGHNFCKDCIGQYFVIRREMGEVGEVRCPVCQIRIEEESIRPNWQLASLVENLNLQSQKLGTGYLCRTHKEKCLLFCKEDQELMCWVCEKTAKHKNHSVLPLEEAAPIYKDQIVNYSETLKGKKEKMVVLMADKNKESQDLLDQIETEKEKAVTTFRQLHQFLEEQENRLLAQMEEVIVEVERERENHLDKLGKELQSLEGIIREMEEKLQQPAVDLLQDIENFLERCKAENSYLDPSVSFPVDVKWKIWDFCDRTLFLEGVMKQFQDALEKGLELQKVNVHLDPGTAHAMLIVSEDCKSVRWSKKPKKVPDNPERFDVRLFVLGHEEFRAGRHFWEVTVGSEGDWCVGVAKKNMKRKGKLDTSPVGCVWGMWKLKGDYLIHKIKALPLTEQPRKICVLLNCEGGRVAFYDADRGTLIYAYPGGSLPRETLLPFCFLNGNNCVSFCY